MGKFFHHILAFTGFFFWRRNAKAGALFGMLLTVLMLAVVWPVCFVLGNGHLDFHDGWCDMCREIRDNPWPVFLYALVLQLFFFGDMVRATFGFPKIKSKSDLAAFVAKTTTKKGAGILVAGCVGVVACLALLEWLTGYYYANLAIVFLASFTLGGAALVPCAIKLGNKRAAAGMATGFVCMLVCFIMIIRFESEWFLMFALLFFTGCAGWIGGVNAMPYKRCADWWTVLPLAVIGVFMVVPEIAYLAMETPVRREMDKLETETGVSWDAELARYTNGVPFEAYPYKTLLERDTELPNPFVSVRKGKAFSDPVTEEDRAAFNAFTSEHAASIALLDEMTAGEIPWFAHEMEWYRKFPYFTTRHRPSFSMTQFYMKRMLFAAADGDARGVMDAFHRVGRLVEFAELGLPKVTALAYGLVAREHVLTWLQAVLPMLPEESLRLLQAELARSIAGAESRMVRACVYECGYLARTVLRGARLAERACMCVDSPPSKYIAYMAPCLFLVERREILRSVRTARTVCAHPELSLKVRYDMAQQEGKRQCPLHSHWMPKEYDYTGAFLLTMLLREHENTAMVAIAVERHRREHGGLPETLDALVPEFLERVPVSQFDGQPLSYETGEIFFPEEEPPFTITGFRVSGSANRISFAVSLP